MSRPWGKLALLGALSAAAVAASVAFGPSDLGFSGLVAAWREGDDVARQILLDIRLPQVILAALVGAALSASGAAFQAVLRNPLADPFILGVSGGAALGATVSIAFVEAAIAWSTWTRPACAFAGAVLMLVLLFALGRRRGRTETTTLLLVGVVLNAFASALILFLATAGDPARFQEIMQTLVGKMGEPAWVKVGVVAGLVAMSTGVLTLCGHTLNVLALGEEEAGHLGLAVERATWIALVAASLATAAGVAFTGIVGFVGLIVPHAVRAVFGSDHRLVVPASAVAGAGFLALADTAARTLTAPVQLPVGVLTPLVGGPFFLVLLLRRLRDRG